jgi:hypothetical protein
LADAAAAHEDFSQMTRAASASLVACMHLADQLAGLAAQENETHARAQREALLHPLAPVWGLLDEAGVSLPLEIPELIEAMTRVAKTSAWIGAEIAGAW